MDVTSCTFAACERIHKTAAQSTLLDFDLPSVTGQPFGVGQQPDSSPLARASWIGGQGTSPKEQNTQQSPGFGFIRAPHIRQS